MSDEMLSQAEIEALFNAAAAGDESASDSTEDSTPADDSPPPSDQNFDGILSDIEKDALGEIGNISMGSAATTLSTLLNHKVSITTPSVSVATMSIIKESYPMPYIVVEVGYTIGIEGNNILAIQASDAAIIADLMMGGDGTSPDPNLSEIHMSAVGESMNQMMGAVATSLSQMFNKKIDISPPIVNLVDFGKEDAIDNLTKNPDPIVRISFRMEVDGLIDSEIMQILPLNVAQGMVKALMGGGELEDTNPAPAEPAPAPAAAPPPPPPPAAAAPPPQQPYPQQPYPPQDQYPQQPYPQQPYPQQPYPQQPYPPPYPQQPYPPPPQSQYAPPLQTNVVTNMPVSPAQFMPLSTAPIQVNEANIGLILDVPLQITVELGRTRKSIKEILELTNGSIVELEKLAGEPVEILVNGQYLAKGEVVVIDENFGVRITEIASPQERAAKIA
ncbi:MAG: flagellar motor switch phosphatase FliY [Selenomonadaceae bacterium]|nr:flagellar motor switch phosphatase FliY [Selenomonadaceae bacterium]